jgi:hypothetical protein
MEGPDEFRCPITMEVMTDPVIGDDGQTYERAAIERALAANPVSPMTRQRMTVASLKPNYALRSAIQRWLQGKSTSLPTKQITAAAPSITHSHTEYVLLITPEVQAEQERLIVKTPARTTSVNPVTQEEHRRRMCRVSVILCLLMVVLIFVFHAMAS